MTLQAPFPWFGGKSPVAADVWAALGNVSGYVEPFFGSGAVLLARPGGGKFETVNDLDGLLANFWRAVKHDAATVADAADWPVNEADLHARHLWLVGQRDRITERLMGDPDWFDAKAAGWWLWGACAWIGSGWCSGAGPWIAQDGVMVDSRQLPRLSAGQGVNRKLPHLDGLGGKGINTIAGAGDRRRFIIDWIDRLSIRLRDVRVACGDWTRVTGPSVLRAGAGICGVFLDPPYDVADRADVYAAESKVAPDVRQWCAANGDDPALRIVLAGYDGEHNELTGMGWRVIEWKARGGYGSQGDGDGRANARRERLWLSPHCVGVKADLFAA
jgi:DNA adenine methylase